MTKPQDHSPAPLSADDYRTKLAQCIAERDQAITGVRGAAGELDLAYTIGNHERGFPELLAFGPMHALMPLLDVLGRRMRAAGTPYADGCLMNLGGRHPVKIINANSQATEYAIQAARYYAVDPAALKIQQVVLCDAAGVFPDEPNCQMPHAAQPVLRAAPPAPASASDAPPEDASGTPSFTTSVVRVTPELARQLLDGSK